MKRVLYITLIFSQLLLVSSCTNWLEETPIDRFTANDFYDTKEGLKSSLFGVYERFADFYEQEFESWVLDVGTDEVSTRQVNDRNGNHRYTFTASHGVAGSWYTKHYATISRSYTVMAHINDPVDITEQEKIEIEAECRFLNAMCYFRMVQLFGPIPLITQEYNEVDNSLIRASVGDIYSFIIEELKFASEPGRLPESRSVEQVRLTRPAAIATLGKVYLTMASYKNQSPIKVDEGLAKVGKRDLGYASSISQTKNELLDLAISTLQPLIGTVAITNNYEEIFLSLTNNKNTNPEFLWQIQFNSNKAGSKWAKDAGGKAAPFDMWQTTAGLGRQTFLSVPDNYYKYSAGDLRRDWNVAGWNFYNFESKKYAFYDVRRGYADMAIASYSSIIKFREQADLYDESIFEDPNERPTNYPYLRYTDVVLMCAEAELMKNNSVGSSTFDEINKIVYRARDGMNPLERLTFLNVEVARYELIKSASTTVFINANNYLNSIIDNPEVSQTEKNRLTEELLVVKNDRDRDVKFWEHAQADVDLWTKGMEKAEGISTDEQQALTAQPFNDYSIATFDLDALKRERQLELMFEGHRKFDLLRWGTLIEAYEGVYTSSSTNQNGMGVINDWNILLPIPLSQIEVSTNPSGFFQNYGY